MKETVISEGENLPEIDTSWILPEQVKVFRSCLESLIDARIPFVVGGAFALYVYTGIGRNTKDLDIFLSPEHLRSALEAVGKNGFRIEVRDSLWLAKAHKDSCLVDFIFATPNQEIRIDTRWIQRRKEVESFGMTIPVVGVEELMVSKIYVARMDRFDGADVAHIVRGSGGRLDWDQILQYLGGDQELLLWHLIFFQFVYPGLVHYLPLSLMDRIYESTRKSRSKPIDEKLFRGMLVDPVSFAVDCEAWGYEDKRNTRSLVDEKGNRI